MFGEGDIECTKELLLPAKRVLKAGSQIKYEAFERRIELWNKIRTNFDSYQDGECGTFLNDLDSHFRSQFDAALVALAVSMKANGESFSATRIFSDDELGLYERIERYNTFELLTVNDIKKKLIRRDENLLALLHDYYVDMDSWVDMSLEDSDIRLTLRGYLKGRWGGYKGKVNAAVAEAVTELDWLGGLIATWKDETQEAMASAGKIAEDARAARDDLDAQERALREAEEALKSREQQIEAAMRAWNDDGQGGRSRYVSAGEAMQYELTFIGRMETKIGDSPVIEGRTFRVEGIEESKEASPGHAGEAGRKALPENRSLTIRLVEKKLLGRRKEYAFNARFASRVERYAGQGYDCDPLGLDDVTVILSDMRDRARSGAVPTVLYLASPTGFERRVRDFIDSEEFHRNFISKYLSLLLLDMETGDLAFNPADETAQAFSGICELEIDSERRERVRLDVRGAMNDALERRDYVVLGDIQRALGNDPLVKSAFYDCSADMDGEVKFIETLGLVMDTRRIKGI